MDGYVTVGTKLDTKSFDAQISELEDKLENMKTEYNSALKAGESPNDAYMLKYAKDIEQTSNKLVDLKAKQLELNKNDFSNVKKSIDKVGDSVGNVIKKVGRWILAVFAIESAYGMVRRGMSLLSQYNDQIKDDINYITYAMASALQPIIENLIGLAYKLLSYVGYIVKAWFGINIFANASADAMNKTAKSAKEIKKSLAGFDEMNVLSNTNGANANMVTPSVDLSKWQGEVPSWIQWIADNKEAVIAGLTAFATGILAIGIGFKVLQGLGIGILLAGIMILVQGIVGFIKDPSWGVFLTILEGISLVIAGIAILMGGWIVAVIALGVAIVTYLIQNFDKLKEIFLKFISWVVETFYKPIGKFFSDLWNGLVDGAIWAINGVKSVFSTIGNFFQGVFNTIKNIFKKIGQTIGDVIGSAFKTAINAVLSLADTIINAPIRAINNLIGVINKVPGINLGKLTEIKIPRLKSGAIVNYPNKGVYSNGTIRGESGAEGVIPLTDSQAMETLGSAIGRYINVNANIPVIIDGKTVDRQLRRVRANEQFVMNR